MRVAAIHAVRPRRSGSRRSDGLPAGRRSGAPGPRGRVRVAAIWVALAAVAIPAHAAAQLSVGAQLSSGEKYDLGIGPRVVLDLAPLGAGLRVVGSFDYFFPDALQGDEAARSVDAGVEYWEANLNLLYRIGPPLVLVSPYVGGGLNLARLEVGDFASTERGVNLLAGVSLDAGGLSPFVEFRYEVEGGEQWVLTGGLVF